MTACLGQRETARSEAWGLPLSGLSPVHGPKTDQDQIARADFGLFGHVGYTHKYAPLLPGRDVENDLDDLATQLTDKATLRWVGLARPRCGFLVLLGRQHARRGVHVSSHWYCDLARW